MEILNKNYKIALSIYKNECTVEQYKEAYKNLLDNKNELILNLNSKKVKQLKSFLGQLGSWTDSRDKKADLIRKIFSSLEDYFLMGQSICYTFGEGTHETAKTALIEGVNAEFLADFYEKRRIKKAEQEKSVSNPETIQEFREFIHLKGKEKLTPEQLEKFETLCADSMLNRQKKEAEQKAIVQKVDIKNAEFELYQTKHSKTGEDIFTVLMTERVEKETFTELRKKAKNFGGYYSRYTDKNANPPIKAGFNFSTEEEAINFMGLKDSDQSTAEKTEEKKEIVKASAAERMRERANAQIEKANESLNQDRQVNTHKRIAEAGRAEEKAQNEIIFAKKMLCVADGLENGSIKYLHALRNGKQLEQLGTLLNRGYYNRVEYKDRDREEKNASLDVNFVVYPFPKYGVNVISTVFSNYSDVDGMKQGVKKILDYSKKYADKNDYLTLEGSYIIELFKKTASKISDKWKKDRILDEIKDFERIQKMGLTNLTLLKTALRELGELGKGTGLTQEQKDETELKKLERSFVTKKISGFFPTPNPLIEKMFSMAKVFENETILEPSAGLGHIATAIKNKFPENKLNVIEYNHSLSEVLNKKGFETENADFLETSKKYDVIFMNPPFEKNQDIDHVRHAFSLLNNGGRLVSIMAGNKSGTQKKVAEFMDFVNEFGHMEQNEEGSFKSAFITTGVNTVTVYLEKPTPEEEPEEEHQEEEPQHTPQAEEIQTKDIICNGSYMLF
jgi:phospholipid N-methyltransferase